MAHIRGHVVKGGNDKSKAVDAYRKQGNFDTYIIKVVDYHNEYLYISNSDSKEPQFGDEIVVLVKQDTPQLPSGDFDLILKVQSYFPYSVGWSLRSLNNWLVYDPMAQINDEMDHH